MTWSALKWCLVVVLAVGCGGGAPAPGVARARPSPPDLEHWYQIEARGAVLGTERVRWWRESKGGVLWTDRTWHLRVGGRTEHRVVHEELRVDAAGAPISGRVDDGGVGVTLNRVADGGLILQPALGRVRRLLPPPGARLVGVPPSPGPGAVIEPWTLEIHQPVAAGARLQLSPTNWVELDSDGFVMASRDGPFTRVRVDAPPLIDAVDPTSLFGVAVTAVERPRRARHATFRVGGVEALPQGDRQRVQGDLVEVDAPIPAAVGRAPVRASSGPWLQDEDGLGVGSPELVARSEEVIAGARDRREAVARLVRHLHAAIAHQATWSTPSPSDALLRGQGDCNDVASAFVALARSGGIPARLVAGLVYLDTQTGPRLVPHVWAEVDTGPPTGWVGVDPVFGQPIADAARLQLARGDLAERSALLDRVDRAKIEIVEVR